MSEILEAKYNVIQIDICNIQPNGTRMRDKATFSGKAFQCFRYKDLNLCLDTDLVTSFMVKSILFIKR